MRSPPQKFCTIFCSNKNNNKNVYTYYILLKSLKIFLGEIYYTYILLFFVVFCATLIIIHIAFSSFLQREIYIFLVKKVYKYYTIYFL